MNYEIYNLIHMTLLPVPQGILAGYRHTNPILCGCLVVSTG